MKKYKKGNHITTMGELAEWIDAGGMIYIRHKVYHPGWVISMQYRELSNRVKYGDVWEAVKNELTTEDKDGKIVS